jgi:hypothetical protein
VSTSSQQALPPPRQGRTSCVSLGQHASCCLARSRNNLFKVSNLLKKRMVPLLSL